MVARLIPKSYRSVTGRFASTKNQAPVSFESTLEKDFYLLLEFDGQVESFEEQPLTLTYLSAEGQTRRYTPDVLIRYRSDPSGQPLLPPTLCEVKYRRDLRDHWTEYKPKFRAAGRYVKQQGWCFRLVTEREIRTPRLNAIRFLRRYRYLRVEAGDIGQLLTALHRQPETTPEALLAAMGVDRGQQTYLITTLWHLVATERIGIDFSQPLTMQSRLWLII
ncbi:MAG TPA: TnsA endonuclease N-terminal domain-containing protein [Candidatus Competibacteraceae bacterium]|nr:TnsA endonuclease N-terminal domain-containing protein [Candidatus Competibacteraceae bacterium]